MNAGIPFKFPDEKPQPGSAAAPASGRKKILIVDDSAVILKAFSTRLMSNGYEVLTARDGAGAVSTVRKERPDLILLDLNFPPDVAHGGGVAWDGFLIITWLRRLDEGKNVPIIVMTSEEAAKHKDRVLAAGAVGFFHKPVNVEELLAAVAKALGDGGKPAA